MSLDKLEVVGSRLDMRDMKQKQSDHMDKLIPLMLRLERVMQVRRAMEVEALRIRLWNEDKSEQCIDSDSEVFN